MSKKNPIVKTITTVATTYKTSVSETKETNYETFTLKKQGDRHWHIGVEYGAQISVADYEVEPYLKMLKKAVKRTTNKSCYVRGEEPNNEPIEHKTSNIGYSVDAICPEELQFDKKHVSFTELVLSEIDGKWAMGNSHNLILLEVPYLKAYIVLLKKAKELITQKV